MIIELLSKTVKRNVENLLNVDFSTSDYWEIIGDWSIFGGQLLSNASLGNAKSEIPNLVPFKKYKITIDVASLESSFYVSLGDLRYNPKCTAKIIQTGVQTIEVEAASLSKYLYVSGGTFSTSDLVINSISVTHEEDEYFYEPLDVFDDFQIKYNHQYEDYKEVGGKRIPYTNKFKVPLTDRNRKLCGIPFDATYPLFRSTKAQVLKHDGELSFTATAEINRSVINVLAPYIELSITDKISKALSDLSVFKMSDLLAGDSFNLRDSSVYGNQNETSKPYVFPYYNFNNKIQTFSTDPKRGLSQLQPTFILKDLVSNIFDFVGTGIESKFLNTDDELYAGVRADQLGLMLPAELRTIDEFKFSEKMHFNANENNESYSIQTRTIGVPNVMTTSARMIPDNIYTADSCGQKLAFNYDSLSDSTDVDYSTMLRGRFCSTVNGKIKVTTSSLSPLNKMTATIGGLCTGEGSFSSFFTFKTTNIIGDLPADLDVKLVKGDFTTEYGAEDTTYETGSEFGTTYDLDKAEVVGVARYVDSYYANGIKYEIEFFDDVVSEFNVEANDDLEFGIVLTNPKDTDYKVTFGGTTAMVQSNTAIYEMTVKDGYIDLVSTNNPTLDNGYDQITTKYSYPTLGSLKQLKMNIDFIDSTDIPTGYRGYDCDNDGHNDIDWIPDVNVNMSETMKSVKDYSLLEVVRMIMERYNLDLYTDSSGNLHIDTSENRLSGIDFQIDHLIDDDMNVGYNYNEQGVLSVRDTNASFYDEDFNKLDKHIVTEEVREEMSISFKSGIVADKMFKDVYYEANYELLKLKNDSNYWGVSDREQVKPKELKPVFCLLEDDEKPLYFPITQADYNEEISSLANPPENEEDEYTSLGFLNTFHFIESVHPKLKLKAVNHTDSFNLLSFEDNYFILGSNNLFQQTWSDDTLGIMNDESVSMTLDVYISEADMATLVDFPHILWKGQRWEFKGFNDYDLTQLDGSLVSINITKL